MKENKDMLAACDAISKCMNTQCCSGFVPTPPSGSDTCIGIYIKDSFNTVWPVPIWIKLKTSEQVLT